MTLLTAFFKVTLPAFFCIFFAQNNGKYELQVQVIGSCTAIDSMEVVFEEPMEGQMPNETGIFLTLDSTSCGRSFYSAEVEFSDSTDIVGNPYLVLIDLHKNGQIIGQQMEITLFAEEARICQLIQY